MSPAAERRPTLLQSRRKCKEAAEALQDLACKPVGLGLFLAGLELWLSRPLKAEYHRKNRGRTWNERLKLPKTRLFQTFNTLLLWRHDPVVPWTTSIYAFSSYLELHPLLYPTNSIEIGLYYYVLGFINLSSRSNCD